MKQMKNQAAVLYAPHDIRIEERPVPTPGMREVLIEIKAVGVCGSDVHYYEHGKIGSYVVRQPLILGHESLGIIVAVGEGVSTNRIGERVAIEPGIPDGVCRQCPVTWPFLSVSFRSLSQTLCENDATPLQIVGRNAEGTKRKKHLDHFF